ncbi:MAG TPA: cyclic pyranopterin monophosphate synthase MoaC [Thermodesulfobacteriota bacterium]|nr:cyclic pyranopterin monophosphate synthase MoaC [Deltaproteobacteria bacterium]HNR14295.1 cyclic pyranopterin monophosphate synthase MoaC [Thermodesulfobacteriota bacterium]HNU70952.1 cyclic pyranopterin monophosphate synthase MoaC [Thermodesulfobacteriota bacterium]HOC39025.1 cyclic pyranopterin monophosphate synthase MoaC [Thermodesulfobacteriota bacterium]
MSGFTHFDDQGKAIMVDVSNKDVTTREAIACGSISMKPETFRLIMDNEIAKGDVLGIARIAGIMAAKRTPDLIPLCHPLAITSVAVDFSPVEEQSRIDIRARVKITGKTGVEMEAFTAVSVAALTIYDMCKAIDRAMVISGIRLQEKSGGKSGHYVWNG